MPIETVHLSDPDSTRGRAARVDADLADPRKHLDEVGGRH